MFNVLIIDDQEFKLNDITSIINPENSTCDTVLDLFGAKRNLSNSYYDLILLDMTIKTLMTKNEFVGIEVLRFLDAEEINSPVIVLTQFYNFKDLRCSDGKQGMFLENKWYNREVDDYTTSCGDIHELPHLHDYLSKNFSNYAGCVLYTQNDQSWVESLKKLLLKIRGGQYESIIIG